MTSYDAHLDALCESYRLKDERRTGWELRNVRDPESVAAHTWGVCLLCLTFADEADVDPGHALCLAVVHDLAEARIGDVPTRADPANEPLAPAEKARRERDAIADLCASSPALERRWLEYERRESRVSKFVKDMDLVDMCLQALVYEVERRYDPDESYDSAYEHLDEFFATAEPRISTPVGEALFETVRARYEAAKGGQ